MGRGDDNLLEDDRADVALKRIFEADPDVRATALPQDLVTRALYRLPPVPPTQAAQHLARRRRQRLAATLVVVLPAVLIGALNVWSVAGSGPQMAFALGDGRAGVSAVVLGTQLAAKPFWNTLQQASPGVLIGALVVALVGIVLWWRLVRRTNAEFEEDAQ